MLKAFKDIVPDISVIGTYSLRSGGATAAANAGISDRLFKRHGRWSSDSAKDGYVKVTCDQAPRLNMGREGMIAG